MSSDVAARDDTEHLAGNDFGPATGNTITGVGTVSGATGTDSGGNIIAIAGAGGSDNSFDANGMLEVAGQYGTLTIDANGNYTYVRNPGSPEGVNDTFTYTLANEAGTTDTAELVIVIGDPPILQAQGTQTIQTNDGVVVLPAGVELSDIRVVGRDLHITLPDGSVMVIPDGAVFVPQLVINGVEVPASNLAALLIDAEPRPAAGELTAAQQSGGGNFALPPGPLDPGVPLGDLLPPTELSFTPPEDDELFDAVDNDPPVITPSAINVSEEGVSSIAAPNPDNVGSPDTTNLRIVNGHINVVDPDGDSVVITLGAPSAALTSQGVPITWTVSPDGHTVIGSAGANEVIRIVINDAGDYTVTLSRPVDHPNAGGEQGTSFVVPVFATDGEDAATPSSITVTIEDDSPTIAGQLAEPILVTDDTTFNINDTDSVTGAFAVSFGADGPHATTPIAYAMGINSGATGLFDTLTGDQVVLTLESGVVVGRAGAGGPVVFTVSVDGSGNVTLDQQRAVVHNDPNDPAETNASGSAATLAADNLVTVSIVATDRDGDPASLTVNIGQNLRFEDDGPSIERNQSAAPTLVTDDTDTPNDTAGPVSFAGLFTGVFGNDGFKDADDNDVEDADAIRFSLSITGGNGTDSGLNDVLTGDNILLRVNASGDIEGYLENNTSVVAFTIDLNPATGQISLEQDRAITHNDPTDPVESGSSAATMASGLIVLNATITDGDGDTDTASANIGDSFRFEDDGPSIERNATAAPTLVTDDTDTPNDTAGPVSFAGLFTADFGADGPKDADDNDVADADAIAYSLAITGGNGTDSGLVDVLTGDRILLRVNGSGDIEGYLENNTSVVAFTIDLNPATGAISLEQDRAITHNDPTDPVESGSSAATMASGLIVLNATITDGDGDTDTASANIGDAFRFEDDGPSIERNQTAAPTLVTDDTDTPNDTAGPVSFAGLFTADFGADGAKDADDNDVADADAITYALSIAGGNGTDSGLNDVVTGDNILLRVVGNTIEGYLENNTSVVAFTLTLDPNTGQISQEQDRAITHDDPNDHVESGNSAATMSANLIVLTATITDGDGDTDTASANIGDAFRFEDDGPVCTDEPQQDVAENNQTISGTFDFDAGADGGGVTHINGTLLVFDVGTGWSQWIAVDDGQIRAQFDGSYQFQTDGNGSGVTSGTFTVTDGDGDTDVCDWAFNITDANAPTAGISNARLDDDGLTGGNPASTAGDLDANVGEIPVVNPSEAIFHGQLTLNFGGDGPGSVTFAAMHNLTGSVGTETVRYSWNGGTSTLTATIEGGARNGTVLFDIVVNQTTGEYTLTLRDNVLHTSGGDENDATAALTYTVTDSDNSPAGGVDGTLNITFDDDAPTATVDGQAALDTITLDETRPEGTDTAGGGAPSGDASATANFADNFVAPIAYGADGPGSTTYQLLLSANGIGSGLYALDAADTSAGDGDGIGQGAQITLSIAGGVITGSANGTDYFTISIDSNTGVVTFTQLNPIWHPTPGSSFDETATLTTASAANVQVQQTVTDADGDVATAQINVGQGVFNIQDDGPDASVNGAAALDTITLDESRPVGTDTAGGGAPTGLATSTANFADNFNGPADAGADGLGSVVYSLTLSANGIASGLFASDATDNVNGGDGDGFGQGASITLSIAGGVITGSANGTDYFTISINSSTGVVTFTQLNPIWHPTPGSSFDETATLSTALASNIQVVQTITDADGDTDSASIDVGQGVFKIQDDGPEITSVTDPLNIDNDANPSGLGNFVYDVGADLNSDFDDISVSGFTVSVNGTPVAPADITFTAGVEDANAANYTFSFDYDTGTGGTATATGTLIFYKTGPNAGKYEVTLTSGPIEGFSILDTGSADAGDFTSYQSASNPGGSPEITVAALSSNFFVQFTGVAEPGSGTGSNNLFTTEGTSGSFDPVTTNNFGDLELFTQDEASVTVSSSAAGVAGNTIQGGEVLDFNLYATDPGGTLGLAPTTSSSSMFLKFDGIGTTEDMIIILKLMDPDTGEFTTRAIMVQNADIIKGPGTGPGAYSGITLDNNDGLVIIESNDYNGPGENWVIVGGQIAGSDEGITGTAINLNGAIGDAGASSGTQAFSTDVHDGPFKITSVGFLTESSEDQQATIEFDVTVTDADGDSVTQQDVTVNIGGAATTSLLADTSSSSSKSGPAVQDDPLASSSLLATGTQEVERVAANSNSVTLAAAVAAAGLAASPAAAHAPGIADVGDSFVSNAMAARAGLTDLGGELAGGRFSALSALQEGGFEFGAMSMASTSHTAIAARHIGELTTNVPMASGPNALLEATELGAMQQMPAPAAAMDIAMPSAESLMAQAAGVEGQVNAKLGAIVQDALQGGGSGPDIDALLSALPGAGLGDNAGLAGLATQIGDHVPAWDMGLGGGFTFDVASIITSEAMVLHHDAVQPVANG